MSTGPAPVVEQSIESLVEPTIRAVQKKAAESFQKWCLSWLKGPELDHALSLLEKAIQLADAAKGIVSKTLICELWLQKASFHEQRAFRLSKRQDVDKSLDCYRKAAEISPENLQAKAGIMYVLHRRYGVNGDHQTLDDLFDAINSLWMVVTQDDGLFVDLLLFTAIALYERAEYDGSSDDLDIAIELLGVECPFRDVQEDRSTIFHLMSANILATRFHISQDIQDLERAEKFVNELQTKPAVMPSHKPFEQETLGKFHQAKFEAFKKQEDMVAMCRCFFEMLTSIDKNSACPQASRITASYQIAKSLRLSYHWIYDPLILTRAHSFAVDALDRIQARKSEWPVQHIEADVRFTLGEIQRSRFEKYGAVPLLEDAVSQFRLSVLLTARREDPFGRRAAELSGILRSRANSASVDQTQKSADLIEAQYWIQEMILGPMPMRRSDRIEMILQLGHLISTRPRSEPLTAQIDKVLQHYSCAVNVECAEFGPRIDSLRSAAEAWTRRGQASENPKRVEDLETALGLFDQIETLSKERGTRSTGHMPPLATLLDALFELTGDAKYGMRCAETNYQIFANSKYELHAKLKAATSFALLAARIVNSKDLTGILSTDPFSKIQFDEALALALELVDDILSESIARSQQLSQLRQYHLFSYLSLWAAKIAEKKPRDIVRVYERGRSVILTRLLNKRTPIAELKEKLPELANRYQRLSERLSSAGNDEVFTNQPIDKFGVESQLRLVVSDIRKNKGFEHFQQPYISDEEFEKLSQSGPTIMLVSGIGSSNGTALVVAQGSVYRQELIGYSADACRAQYSNLTSTVKKWQSSGEDDGGLDQVLSWLWYQVAEPVLDRLGLQGSKIEEEGMELPRVWWILCDWANRLPVHAAGDHRKARDTGVPCAVMDRAISSYSPTLRSLIYSRARMSHFQPDDSLLETGKAPVQRDRRAESPKILTTAMPTTESLDAGDLATTDQGKPVSRFSKALSAATPATPEFSTEDTDAEIQKLSISEEPSNKAPRALLAAMPTTPDHIALPNAVTEIAVAKTLLSPNYTISSFSSPAPMRKDIIQGLRTCTIAHLACHGEADALDPLKSKLLLSDWRPKPLSVRFIMRMELEKCQLAYLSACETAVNHDHALAEEALHICGAFQMAGVPNVVATWWEILDKEACSIAEAFYAGLKVGRQDGVVDIGRSARALHAATKSAREAGMAPFVWAGYAHFGA
ncbi:MAG: hypothetical protein Q9191_006775 [Dirinaria sp. TL-2023a]